VAGRTFFLLTGKGCGATRDGSSITPVTDESELTDEMVVVHPKRQWPDKPLKTDGSDQPIPIPQDLALLLSASVQRYPSEMMVTNGPGTDRCGPWLIECAIPRVREQIDGLPEGFTFHDLRHYLASLLIASGADIKTVQARMRHATARTTLDTYGHLWPDADESTRSAIGAVIRQRIESPADQLRTRTTDA
jgi:integrase